MENSGSRTSASLARIAQTVHKIDQERGYRSRNTHRPNLGSLRQRSCPVKRRFFEGGWWQNSGLRNGRLAGQLFQDLPYQVNGDCNESEFRASRGSMSSASARELAVLTGRLTRQPSAGDRTNPRLACDGMQASDRTAHTQSVRWIWFNPITLMVDACNQDSAG